jgi:hypothetical protein
MYHFISSHSAAITGTGTYLTIYETVTPCRISADSGTSLDSSTTSTHRTKRLRQTQQKNPPKYQQIEKLQRLNTRGFLPFRQRLSRHLVAGA